MAKFVELLGKLVELAAKAITGPLQSLLDFARKAIEIEFKSDAGKINWLGLLGALILYIIFQVKSVFSTIMSVISHASKSSSPDNFLAIFIIYFIMFFVCVILLHLNDRTRTPKE